MELLLEKSKKYMVYTEEEADRLVEEARKNGYLVDHKISYKETKKSSYYIVTIKEKLLTLGEAKDKMSVE